MKFNKQIDDGFTGDPNSLSRIQHPKKPRKKAKVYTSTDAIDGVTRTKTTVSWNGNTWKVQQHTPWATDWDNTTKTYSSSPNSFVKLP